MKIYKDKDLISEVQTLDFGIVEAGETEIKTFWVYNDSNAYYRKMKFNIEHEEVSILEAPEELAPQAVGELKVEWKPSITLKEGLKTSLKITGKELWG